MDIDQTFSGRVTKSVQEKWGIANYYPAIEFGQPPNPVPSRVFIHKSKVVGGVMPELGRAGDFQAWPRALSGGASAGA